MKKLVFFLLLIPSLSFSQTMLSTLYRNYDLYQTYLTDGPLSRAEVTYQRLIRGTSLMEAYLWGSLTGNLDTMSVSKAAFDALYGKTHQDATFSLTAVSYLDLDSLFIGGVKIVNFYPRDSIDAWIAEAGLSGAYDSTVMATEYDIATMVTFSDTNIIATQYDLTALLAFTDTTSTVATQYDINGMVEFTDTTAIMATQYDIVNMVETADISGMVEFSDTVSIMATQYDLTNFSTDSGDSTFWSLNVYDTIILMKEGLTNGSYLVSYTNGIFGIGSIVSGTYAAPQIFVSGSGGLIYGSTTALRLDFATTASSTSPNLMPRYDDSNTGYSWVSADKLGLVAGGQSVLTSEYNVSASKSITDAKDSLRVTGIDVVRITADSVLFNNGWVKNPLHYDDVPAENSLRLITPAGAQAYATLEADLDTPVSASLTDGAPTEVEINAALSTDPATAASGARYLIKDTDGTALMYVVWSDGSDWWYEALTKAL